MSQPGETIWGELTIENGAIYAVNNVAMLTLTGSTYVNNGISASGGVLMGTKNTSVLNVDSTHFTNNKEKMTAVLSPTMDI